MCKVPIKAQRKRLLIIGSKVLVMSLLLNGWLAGNCLAIGLSIMPAKAKKVPLAVSGYDKLQVGASPATHDKMAQPAMSGNGLDNNRPLNLSPLTLHDQDSAGGTSAGGTGNGVDAADGDVLKSTVTTNDYLAKPGSDQAMQSKSVMGKDANSSKTLVKKASKVGLGPVQLIESEDESNKKVDAVVAAEQMQLNDLWEATLTRSPDIQFIVQKLQPTSNPAHWCCCRCGYFAGQKRQKSRRSPR